MRYICILLLFLFSTYTKAIYSKSYCIINGNKKIIAGKKYLKARAPASTVKLLTAMVVLDKINPNAYLVTPKAATHVSPTKLYLKQGEKLTCYDLLSALLLKSANDAAVVLAYGVAGGQRKFCQLMNQKAKKIGCKNSYFITPNGLPARGQHSCAYDLALIALHARKYKTIKKILTLRRKVVKTSFGRTMKLKTYNRLIHKHIYGKTGWTIRAQNTFAGFYTSSSGKRYAIAVMGTPRRKLMWRDIEKLTGASQRTLHKNTKTLQKLLKTKGYYTGKIDGICGPKTKTAIKRFQQANKLKVDGIAGPNTWKKLLK